MNAIDKVVTIECVFCFCDLRAFHIFFRRLGENDKSKVLFWRFWGIRRRIVGKNAMEYGFKLVILTKSGSL